MADDLSVKIGAEASGFVSGVQQVKAETQSLAQILNSAFANMTGAIREPLDALAMMKSSLRETAEVAGLVYAVDKLKEFATEMAELGERTLNSAYLLGQSVGSYTQLAGAFTLVGGNADEAQRTLERLALSVQRVSEGNKTATAAFHNLGISTEEVKAQGNDLTGLLTLIITRYSELAPSLRNIGVLHEVAGRGVDQLAGALRSGGDGWQEALKGAQDYSRAMEATAPAMADSAEHMNALKLAVMTLSADGFGLIKPVVDDVVGALNGFVSALDLAIRPMSDAAREMSGMEVAFRVVIQTVRDIITILHLFADTLAFLATAARANGEELHAIFIGIKEEIIAAVTGGDIEAAYDRMMGRLEALTVSRGAELVAQWAKISGEISALFVPGGGETVLPTMTVTAPRGGRALGTEHAGGGGGKKESDDRMSEWRDELRQKLEAEQNFFNDSKAEELAFWEQKLAIVSAGSKQDLKLRREIATQIFELEKSIARQTEQQAIAEQTSKARAADVVYAGKKQHLDAEVTLGKVSPTEGISQEQALLDEKWALDQQYFAAKLEAAAKDVATEKKINDEKYIA
jgi:hypothetical protein